MNMVFHEPRWVMSMGMFQDAGFADVPEARFISDIAAGFMSAMGPGMFMPGIFMSWAQVVSGSTNRINFKKNL
jgi:hypothetical protein